MSESAEDRITEIETRLDLATSILAGLAPLDANEAERIGARIDQLTAQIAAISPQGEPSSDAGGA